MHEVFWTADTCASLYFPSLLLFLLAFACRFDLQFWKKVVFISALLVCVSIPSPIWLTTIISFTFVKLLKYNEIWYKKLFIPWCSKTFCLSRFHFTKITRHSKNDLVPEEFLLSSGRLLLFLRLLLLFPPSCHLCIWHTCFRIDRPLFHVVITKNPFPRQLT